MITLNTNPAAKSSVQDNLWHVASSDNSGSPDMKFVWQIYTGGQERIRVKQYPDPENGKAYFDAGPTVRNQMTYAWFEPTEASPYVDQPDINGEIGIVYQVRVGEEVSGTTYLNYASGEVSGYNWCPNMEQRRTNLLTAKLNKWLTPRPRTAYTKGGENLFIGFYTNAATVQLKVEGFNENNVSVCSDTGASVACPIGFLQMNIGTDALTTYFPGLAFDLAATKYYDVWFNSLEKIRVYLTCNPKYTTVLIHFLNRLGMWDTARFDLVSRLTLDVQRKGFEKRDYRNNGNAVDYYSSSNRYYESKINYENVADWGYKLTADAMTDEDYIWLGDLIQSAQILMELDGYYYPVTIKNTNYEYSKHVNNRLRPLELEFEMNQTRHTHLR